MFESMKPMLTPDNVMLAFLGLLVLAGIIFGFWLKGYLRAQRAIEALQDEERQRDELAPDLRMQAIKWKGTKAAPDEPTERELAEKIKMALQQRKLNGNK